MEPTHPDRLVGNVTAPSAGGFPGPGGEVSENAASFSGEHSIRFPSPHRLMGGILETVCMIGPRSIRSIHRTPWFSMESPGVPIFPLQPGSGCVLFLLRRT
ncbi:MAG: hypothetical protein ACOX52_15790 [Verrucomicrobiota bacterium]